MSVESYDMYPNQRTSRDPAIPIKIGMCLSCTELKEELTTAKSCLALQYEQSKEIAKNLTEALELLKRFVDEHHEVGLSSRYEYPVCAYCGFRWPCNHEQVRRFVEKVEGKK